MDDKKLLFIVNPRAGKTKSLAPLFDAAAIYSEAGYLVSVRKTTHRGEATELAESLGPEFDVVVCPGVTIGENSIIGAGAVVTRSIPPNSVAVGNPARVIKALDPSVPRAIEAASVGVISRGETGERA